MRAASSSAPSRGRLAGAAHAGIVTLRWSAWLISAAGSLAVLMQPVSAEAQLALGAAVIAVMAAIWIVLPRSRFTRTVFLAIGTSVVIRYVYWRVTSTLPPATDPIGLVLGSLLLAAELYCVLILAISLIVNADPLDRTAPQISDEMSLPTVDVFIPTYNEDDYILATTIAAAKAIDYPTEKMIVWLLDDGGTDQKCQDMDPTKAAAARRRRDALKDLCDALGARYLTRARNEHAKAGNLNNGLANSSGEIVVVFDADHAPFRAFLKETIGFFATDPKLFLVQTPHVFLNPDPIEKNLRTFEHMPSENEMFYGITQRGLDKWNGSFFCGSAALLRRAALQVTGGFSGITITEDCETAFELHAKGWTSIYVDKPLIAGLQPETFASFIGQRSRWCQGMFQIMLLKNPALKRGLKPIQRLAYLSSMTFWFFPLPRLAFMLAPLLHIFFDVKIFVSAVDEAVAYTATYVLVNMMMQNYLYGHFRWPWMSELYEYVQGVYLAKAIAAVILSPRKPTFNVTAKGIAMDGERLSPLAAPYFVIFALIAAGTVTAGYRYLYEPGVSNLMLVVGLWSLFNLVIAGAALGVVAERPPLERIPGLPVRRLGTLIFENDGADPGGGGGGSRMNVEITRASPCGCSGRIVPGPADVALAGIGRARLTIASVVPGRTLTGLDVLVGPGDSGTVNASYLDPKPVAYASIVDLMYGDAGPLSAFLAGRRRHKNLLLGSLQFLRWGVLEPLRAVRSAVIELRRKPSAPIAAAPLDLPLPVFAKPAATAALGNWLAMMVELAAAERSHETPPVVIDPSNSAWLGDMLDMAAAETRHVRAPQAAPRISRRALAA